VSGGLLTLAGKRERGGEGYVNVFELLGPEGLGLPTTTLLTFKSVTVFALGEVQAVELGNGGKGYVNVFELWVVRG
jgi:hypothetical protein